MNEETLIGYVSTAPRNSEGRVTFQLYLGDENPVPVGCMSSLRFDQSKALELNDHVILKGHREFGYFMFDTLEKA